MTRTAASPASVPDRIARRRSKIAHRVAAVAGAAGAAAAGESSAITYVPTAGVVAAQGIPGFSFTAPTNVTSGTLRPPAEPGLTAWDIDGSGSVDFSVLHGVNVFPYSEPYAGLRPLNPFSVNANGLIATAGTPSAKLRNVADGSAVGPLAVWNNNVQAMTTSFVNRQTPAFPTNQPGVIGFRFAFGNAANEYYYGWASLTIDALSPAGQGFKITEAFYQSTPNTAINVGAVPVPEPANMALLAVGATGVAAWRARRKRQSAAG